MALYVDERGEHTFSYLANGDEFLSQLTIASDQSMRQTMFKRIRGSYIYVGKRKRPFRSSFLTRANIKHEDGEKHRDGGEKRKLSIWQASSPSRVRSTFKCEYVVLIFLLLFYFAFLLFSPIKLTEDDILVQSEVAA